MLDTTKREPSGSPKHSARRRARAKARRRRPRLKLHSMPWNSLNKFQKPRRMKAFDVLKDMRKKGLSFSYACKLEKANRATIERYLRGAIFRRHGRIIAKRFDILPRNMQVNSSGKAFFVEIRDSREASRLGSYQQSVKDYLYDGSAELLDTFRGEGITDSSGTFYTFETDVKN